MGCVSDDKLVFNEVFKQIETNKQSYANYIFALTMGLGKTILMATSIFYEFLLANKFPKTSRYCHNALVFAPDKTVLQSLKEIETFDKKLEFDLFEAKERFGRGMETKIAEGVLATRIIEVQSLRLFFPSNCGGLPAQ